MSRNRDERVLLICDEAYLMIDQKVPQSLAYLRNVMKRARKYEAALGIISHSVIDFLSESIKQYGQALLDILCYKLLMGTDGPNLKETAKLYDLTEAEQELLLARKRLLCIILGPVVFLLLLIALLLYLITSPFSMSGWLVGAGLDALEAFQKDYGYNQSIGIYEQDYLDGAGQNYDGVVFTDGATEVVYFNQLDGRWKDKPCGTDNIGGYACGSTSMSIVVSSLAGETVAPPHMAQWSVDNG